MFTETEGVERRGVSDVLLDEAVLAASQYEKDLPLEFYSSLAAMSEASGLPAVAELWREEITCHIEDPTDLEALLYWEFSYSDPRNAFGEIYGHYENDLGQIPIDFLPRLMRLARIANPLKLYELSELRGAESYDFPEGEVAAFECHIRAGDYYKAKESFYNLHDARSEMEEGGYSYAKQYSSVFAYEDVQGALEQMILYLCINHPDSIIEDTESPFYDPYPQYQMLNSLQEFYNYRDAAIGLMKCAAKDNDYRIFQDVLYSLVNRIGFTDDAFRTRAMIYRVLGEVQDEELQRKLVKKYLGEDFFRKLSKVHVNESIIAIEEMYQRGRYPRQDYRYFDTSAIVARSSAPGTEVLNSDFVSSSGLSVRYSLLALSDEDVAEHLKQFKLKLAFKTLHKRNPQVLEREIDTLGEALLSQEGRNLHYIVPLWAKFIREIGSECSVLPDVVDKLYTNFACAAARRSAERDDPQVLDYVLNHLELTGDQEIDAITQAARIIANKTR